MSGYEELVAAIRAALSTAAEGKTLTAQGRSALVDGAAALTGISRGSTSYQLRTALEALSAAIQAAERAEEVEATVFEAMNVYIAEIGGNGPAVPTTSQPTEPQPQRRSGAQRGPDGKIDFRALAARAGITGADIAARSMDQVPDFNPLRPNPACYQGLAPRQKGEPVLGNLFFADGRKWNTKPLESSRGDSQFTIDNIKPEYRHLKPVKGHLEGNVAAWMIDEENQHREMVLYLNESPCDHRGKGCHANLEQFLLKGYTLHVWSRNDRGEWRGKRFRGTGEAFNNRP